MKRKTAIFLVAVLGAILLCACGADKDDSDKSTGSSSGGGKGTYEIALVTDVGNIDDQSFNQSSWEGVSKFADENDISYSYYRPSEDSTEARVETVKTAIDKGAKVVVCPGYLFEDVIYQIQNEYPKIQFLLLDGEPHDSQKNYETAANVHCILYEEEQAGYLAGYGAVKDGYTKLGFLGGMEVPSVQRYGYGFIQGAEAAATEMKKDIDMKYWYSGSFVATDDIKTKMDGWYTEGTQVVFACGGGIYLSAVQAAVQADGKVIGVDVDQSGESDVIITSAVKELSNSVVSSLEKLYDNDTVWPEELAGETAVLGAEEDGVGLPTTDDAWRFEKFTVNEYKDIYDKIKSGDLTVSSDVNALPNTTKVKVDLQQ